MTASPSTVTIVGPERRVEAIKTAMTDPVDATGVVGEATFTTHAYVSDPLVRVRAPQPIQVTRYHRKDVRRVRPTLSER